MFSNVNLLISNIGITLFLSGLIFLCEDTPEIVLDKVSLVLVVSSLNDETFFCKCTRGVILNLILLSEDDNCNVLFVLGLEFDWG